MDESAYTRLVHMFIKLTNASNGHQGDPIYINVDHITAIYEHSRDGGSLVTYVHSSIGSPVTWEAEESAKQIMNIIEEDKV